LPVELRQRGRRDRPAPNPVDEERRAKEPDERGPGERRIDRVEDQVERRGVRFGGKRQGIERLVRDAR
jgi:hypothetical protein